MEFRTRGLLCSGEFRLNSPVLHRRGVRRCCSRIRVTSWSTRPALGLHFLLPQSALGQYPSASRATASTSRCALDSWLNISSRKRMRLKPSTALFASTATCARQSGASPSSHVCKLCSSPRFDCPCLMCRMHKCRERMDALERPRLTVGPVCQTMRDEEAEIAWPHHHLVRLSEFCTPYVGSSS